MASGKVFPASQTHRAIRPAISASSRSASRSSAAARSGTLTADQATREACAQSTADRTMSGVASLTSPMVTSGRAGDTTGRAGRSPRSPFTRDPAVHVRLSSLTDFAHSASVAESPRS